MSHHGHTSKTSESSSGSGIKDILAGGISGGVTRMLIAPLDVIKIRFQVQTGPSWKTPLSHSPGYNYAGILHCIKTIFRDEGLRAFWNGNLLAEMLYISYVGVQFGSYALFHDTALNAIPLSQRESAQGYVSLLSGGMAAMSAISVSYPLDLLRTRFAAQAHPKTYTSIPSAIKLIYQTDGIRGFYSGLGPTCLSLVPSMAIQFALYDWFKRTWFGGRESSNPLLHLTAGALAGVISKLSVLPLDVLKKRLQIQGLYHHRAKVVQNPHHNPSIHSTNHSINNPTSSYSSNMTSPQHSIQNHSHQISHPPSKHSLTDVVKQILKNDGLKGFFRGAVPSALKAGVSAALTFAFYEESKRLLVGIMSKID